MCTLTYIPKDEGFVWTHNRDESPKRIAGQLVQKETLLYPEEPISKGSWISLAKNGTIASILNGAWERQSYEVSTVRSRGLLLLDFFEYEDIHSFYEKYTFEGIQPFTMISYSNGELWDLRWDKKKKGLEKKMPPKYISGPQLCCIAQKYAKTAKIGSMTFANRTITKR